MAKTGGFWLRIILTILARKGRPVRTFPLAAVVFVLGAVVGAAGDNLSAPVSPPVFSAGAELVKVTVTVRDSKGALVPDLKAEDFVVSEDGHRQNLQLFAPAVVPGHDDALDLDLGLLLDTSESMAQEIRLSQEAATRFLEAIPRARDLLTIFFDEDIRISHYDSEHQQGSSSGSWTRGPRAGPLSTTPSPSTSPASKGLPGARCSCS